MAPVGDCAPSVTTNGPLPTLSFTCPNSAEPRKVTVAAPAVRATNHGGPGAALAARIPVSR